MEITSIKPFLAIMVSLFGSLFIIASYKRPNLRESWTFVIAFIKFGIVVSMIPAVLGGQKIVYDLVEVLPGVGISFRVDAFGLLFALVSSSLWIVTSVYSIGYMRSPQRAFPNPVLRLFCPGALFGCRGCIFRQSPHPISLL